MSTFRVDTWAPNLSNGVPKDLNSPFAGSGVFGVLAVNNWSVNENSSVGFWIPLLWSGDRAFLGLLNFTLTTASKDEDSIISKTQDGRNEQALRELKKGAAIEKYRDLW